MSDPPRLTLPLELPAVQPDFALEAALMRHGHRLVAGVDEAGRGPLAGPVVAAAVILDPEAIPKSLDDSKKLSATRRETLFHEVLIGARAVSWAAASAPTLDRLNILQATLRVMSQAVGGLSCGCDHALIDGRDVPPALRGSASAIIKGDARSLSIAAASIIAKVVRDRMMQRADLDYPQFGFASHKGYGAARHRAVILENGPCPLHRRSFAPLRDRT